MKFIFRSLRTKADQQQGLKETYLICVEAPKRVVEQSFSYLELKGEPVKIFQGLCNFTEVTQALKFVEPKIVDEDSIPHSQSKLKDYPKLQAYLSKHMTDGLYLLQFRKCSDISCCQIRGK